MKRIKELAARFPEYRHRRFWVMLRFGENPTVVNRKRIQRLMQLTDLQVKVKRVFERLYQK